MEYLRSHHMDILAENSKKETILNIVENMAYEESLDTVAKWTARAEIWTQKNCIVKIALRKDNTKFQNISMNVFREIIKYA